MSSRTTSAQNGGHAAASEHPLHGVAVGERGFDLAQGGADDAEDSGQVTRYDSA